jgi:hypothetical protein
VDPNGLFHQDVFAGFQGANCHGNVKLVRDGDYDCLDVLVGQHGVVVAEGFFGSNTVATLPSISYMRGRVGFITCSVTFSAGLTVHDRPLV